MPERRRVFLLIAILISTAFITIAVSTTLLYRTALEEERARLMETAQSQARFLEAVARFNAIYSTDYPEGALAATLSQIREAHEKYTGFGETGEFTLAKEEDGQIVFLLSHRHFDTDIPQPIPFESNLAEPMNRALLGLSGTLIGLDYRGQTVLAAYEPVESLGWGIVAKIDLREIRAPFLRSGLIAGGISILVITLGALLFFKVTEPLLQRLAEGREYFRTTLYSIGDAVLVVDTEGRIQQMNQVAETLTGWKETEAQGQPIQTIFQIVNEETRARVEDPVRRVLQEGEIVGLPNQTLLIARDRSERPIADSGAPIRDDGGKIAGVVLVFRDQSEQRKAQKALQENEERYRHLFNNMLNGFAFHELIVDETGKPIDYVFLEVNQAFEKLTNLRRDQTIGKKATDVLPGIENDPVDWIGRYGKVALTGEDTRFIAYAQALDRWYSVLAFSPQKGRFAAVFDDITERKQAEDEQKKAQEMLAAQNARLLALYQVGQLLNSTLDVHDILDRLTFEAMQVTRAECGQVLLVSQDNRTFERHSLRGFSEKEAENLEATTLPLNRGINGRAYLTRHAVRVDNVRLETDYVGTVARTRAELAIPIIRDDEVIGTIDLQSPEVGAFSEVDLQYLDTLADRAAIAICNARLYKELEEYSSILEQAVEERTANLRQTTERVETILHNSPAAILLLSPDGTIDRVNPAFHTLLGYGEGETQKLTLDALVPEDMQQSLAQTLHLVREEIHTLRIVVTARRKNGTTFDAEIALAPVTEENSVLGIVGIIHDISAMKNLERLKDQFLSTAAHELRTPLVSIQGFSEILLTRDLEAERRDRYLSTINEQAVQLAQIINDLLDVSRLEAGRKLDIKKAPVNVDNVIAKALDSFRETTPEHQIVHHRPDEAISVPADTFRLTQVMRNLISNAVKYSPEGGTISVRSQQRPEHLLISIQDEGIGMTPEQMEHLFEAFWRADTVERETGGTGLGLRICQLIITGHGGTIWAESAIGEGTTFYFTLPLDDTKPAGEGHGRPGNTP